MEQQQQQKMITLANDLPNSQVNQFPYEQGFEEKFLVNQEFAECYTCPICQEIPRHPVLLRQCRHFFCEACIEQQNKIAIKDGNVHMGHLICAVCKTKNYTSQTMPFEDFYTVVKKGYHLVKIRCPLGCNFIGDPLEMDDHESFECELREVVCPSPGCGVKMSYKRMQDEHIQVCPNLLVHCRTCLLPVKRARLESHNCIKRMAIALLGIILILVSCVTFISP